MKKWSERKLIKYICHEWGIKEHQFKCQPGIYPNLLEIYCRCFHTEIIEEYRKWFDEHFRNPHQAISYFLPNPMEQNQNE